MLNNDEGSGVSFILKSLHPSTYWLSSDYPLFPQQQSYSYMDGIIRVAW